MCCIYSEQYIICSKLCNNIIDILDGYMWVSTHMQAYYYIVINANNTSTL